MGRALGAERLRRLTSLFLESRGRVRRVSSYGATRASENLATSQTRGCSSSGLQSSISGKVGRVGKIGEDSYFCDLSRRTRWQGFASSAAEKKPEADAEKISVTFVDKDGDETEIKVPVGMSMLEAAHENDIELEGACEGSLACSTCHVIVVSEDLYNKLPEPSDEENDMLDLAFGLTETSRLGCQVIAKPELDGMRLALPAATRNFAVDGHVPKPH